MAITLIRSIIAAAGLILAAPLSAQSLDTARLALNYSAAQDPAGDSIWTNAVNQNNGLNFASAPNRIAIASNEFGLVVAGYRDGASGLTGFFDQSTPQRSAVDATFEMWVNVSTVAGPTDQVIFEAGGAERGLSFVLSNRQLRFNVKGDAAATSTITRALTVGVHHIVGVIRCRDDGLANDSIELYHNGALVQRVGNLLIEDWAGSNTSGVGMPASSVAGASSAQDFSGDIASLRYYQGRAFTSAEVVAARDAFKRREQVTVWVTGRGSYADTVVSSAAAVGAAPAAFTPTKVQRVGNTYWGLNFVESDGTDGLAVKQFKRLDVYSSPNSRDWTFIRTGISRTDHPELLDARLTSRQFVNTANGKWAIYAKHHYARTARKNLIGLHADTIGGPYRLAFTTRPYGYSSGDLGITRDGGSVYIISAATDEGEINILKTSANGDALVELTKNLKWNLPSGAEDHREAPSLFSRGGYYFLTTSGKTGWKPNQQKYAYATSLGGTWSRLYDLGDETGFHSQLFFTSGTDGTETSNKIFSSTRNAPQWGGAGGSRPVYLPMYFNTPTDLAVNYYDSMVVNASTGTVEGVNLDHGRQLAVTRAFAPGGSDNLSALIDGNEATTWSNGNNASRKEIRWDLGSAKRVKALKLMPVQYLRWAFIADIYVGDGVNWTRVFPVAEAPPVIPMTAFPAPLDVLDATGRYVRMVLVRNYNAEETTPGIINSFGFHETEIWGEASSAGLEVNQTFNAGANGSNPPGWIVSGGAGTGFSVAAAPSASNKSVRISDTNASQQVQGIYSFTQQKGSTVVFETRWRPDSAGSGEYLRLLQGSTIALELINSSAAAGLAYTNRAGTPVRTSALTQGVWHSLRVEINTDADTFDLYLDGKMVWGGGKLRNDVNGVDKLVIGSSGPGSRVSSYFDDIKIDGPMPN